MIKTFFLYFWKHKIATFLMIAVLIGGGYWYYSSSKSNVAVTRYVTSKVEKGMLIANVSGTGQVLPSSQVNVLGRVSGDITVMKVKEGQEVKAGEVLLQTDSRDSALSVNQANNDLKLAQLALDELITPPSQTTIVQAENSLQQAKDDLVKLKLSQDITYKQTQEARQKAMDYLEKSYEDSYNAISNAFLDLPGIITGIDSILHGQDISKAERAVNSGTANSDALLNEFSSYSDTDKMKMDVLLESADSKYSSAKLAFDNNYTDYKAITRYSTKEAIVNVVDKTIETLKKTADATKDSVNALDYWIEYMTDHNRTVFSTVTTFQSSLSSYISKTNSHLTTLIGYKRTIQDYVESQLNNERTLAQLDQNNPLAISQAERSIGELQLKLNDLKTGATALDIQNQKLAVETKRNNLVAAQQSLADHFVRAPFDGVVVDLPLVLGGNVGASTTVATIMTKQKIAQIALNEVDIAKVKIGQKANLTFDAVSDLTITGEVAEIDMSGTVSQGVVSYNVKIAFDVQDERIKPNMTVSANIIVSSKADVLLIPSSAVKSSGDTIYVEILVNGAPQSKNITVGESNDTSYEVLSGLSEGDEIITQTIKSSTASSSTNSAGSSTKAGISGSPPGGDIMRIMR